MNRIGASGSPKSVDQLVASVASRRHGVFTHAEALGAGATDRIVAARISCGRWERLYRSVYRVSGSAPTWRQELAAACLAAGDRAAASHRAAASLHALPGFAARALELSIPRSRRFQGAGIAVHRTRDLDAQDFTVIDAIPVTAVGRTLIDLAAVVSAEVVEEALDDALRRRLVSVARLARRIEALRRPGRPGIALIDDICRARSDPSTTSESELERRFLRLVAKEGLPPPVSQYEIRLDGRLIGRVDFAYPDQRLAIEADGFGSHSGRARWQRDITRGNELLALGWRVLHVSWEDVTRHPKYVARMVRAALALPPHAAPAG